MLFQNEYFGKKVLLTGHTGFKGSWLSIWLNKLGADVIGYSLDPPTEPSMFKICKLNEKIKTVIGDIRDEKKLTDTFKKYQPDIVYHMAAQPLVRASYIKPKETYESNVIGTVNLLESAQHTFSVKAVIVITSDKCYENKEWLYGYREHDAMGGHDPYSSSKGCAELVVSAYRDSFFKQKNIELSTVRAGNVIGGGDWAEDRLIPDFVRAALENKNIVIRNPLAIRPWQHVLEPLSGYLWLGALMLSHKGEFGSCWNFGPRERDALNVSSMIDMAIKRWGKGGMEIDKNEQPHESHLLKLDISKATAALKWQPLYDVNKAINKTIQWYKAYYEKPDRNMYEYTLSQIDEYEEEGRTHKIAWSGLKRGEPDEQSFI